MNAHTTGPWTFKKAEDGCTSVWSEKHPIAAIYSSDNKLDNARLIAAAPELLAALQNILDGGIADPKAVRAAHEVIAKATAA